MFLLLNFINLPNFVGLLLEELGNMCIVVISFPECDVIKFKITLIFVIKAFPTKMSREKFKCLENKKSLWGKIKSIFRQF